MNLPKELRKLCNTHGVDTDEIEDVLAEPEEAGGVWILKISGSLPYATIGGELLTHASYADALDASVKAVMGTKVLKAFSRSGRIVPDYDTKVVPEDPTQLLLIMVPEGMKGIPELGENTLVVPEGLGGFIELRSGKRYLAIPAADQRIDSKPITTAIDPLHYAGRWGDKVIFTAPAVFLEERTWQGRVHRTMIEALKKGEIVEGVRPVLFPEPVRLCRLVLDLGAGDLKASGKIVPK